MTGFWSRVDRSMENAYVFLTATPKLKSDVIKQIRRINGVKEANLVLGIFDIVAKVEMPTIDELERVYMNHIEKIEGLTDSRMHIVCCPRTKK